MPSQHTPIEWRACATSHEPAVSDRLAVLPQYLMPKRALTVAAGRIASARAGALTTALIRRFVARYGVNMAEAANPDPASYAIRENNSMNF